MIMNKVFNISRHTKKVFLQLTEGLSIEQLNTIPDGFNNNIIWNFAHLVASQQILCYKLGNAPFTVSEELINQYKKGTRPTEFVSLAEWESIQNLSAETLDQLEKDYNNGIFNDYQSYMTSFGVELNNIEDALLYSCMHDGLHLGVAQAIKKLV